MIGKTIILCIRPYPLMGLLYHKAAIPDISLHSPRKSNKTPERKAAFLLVFRGLARVKRLPSAHGGGLSVELPGSSPPFSIKGETLWGASGK